MAVFIGVGVGIGIGVEEYANGLELQSSRLEPNSHQLSRQVMEYYAPAIRTLGQLLRSSSTEKHFDTDTDPDAEGIGSS